MSVQLVLASGSPRRKELLSYVLEDFEIFITEVQELQEHTGGPVRLVVENAKLKSSAVAKSHPSQWVLGADTLISLDDQVFGKPKDLAEAKSLLLRLSGKTHQVHTGVSLQNLSSDVDLAEVVSTSVTFKNLNSSIIDRYFLKVNPLDKAGAYAIQTSPEMIVESYDGSLSNVIGLPLELLANWFEKYLPKS
jgi:septum formation protein